MKKKRVYLCEGCDFAPEEGVVHGLTECTAAGRRVRAKKHEKGMRFTECKHRKGLPRPIRDPQTQLLVELSRETIKIPNRIQGLARQNRIANIEVKLRKKYKLDD